MARMQKRSLDSADETKTFQKGYHSIRQIGATTIGVFYLEPGWTWEGCIKPIVRTESCQAAHTQYVLSGRIRFKMDDGKEEEYGPGDLVYVPPGPPGHNAWVVGNESFKAMEFGTMDVFHSMSW